MGGSKRRGSDGRWELSWMWVASGAGRQAQGSGAGRQAQGSSQRTSSRRGVAPSDVASSDVGLRRELD